MGGKSRSTMQVDETAPWILFGYTRYSDWWPQRLKIAHSHLIVNLNGRKLCESNEDFLIDKSYTKQ